jgi:hypothetical protein
VRTERTPAHVVAHNFSPAVALGFHFRTPSSPPPLYTMLRLGLISSADRSFACVWCSGGHAKGGVSSIRNGLPVALVQKRQGERQKRPVLDE